MNGEIPKTSNRGCTEGHKPSHILNLESFSIFCCTIHVQISSQTGYKFARTHSSSGRGSEYQNRVLEKNQAVVFHPTVGLFTDYDSRALRIYGRS